MPCHAFDSAFIDTYPFLKSDTVPNLEACPMTTLKNIAWRNLMCCLLLISLLSGCAKGGWSKWMGKRDTPSPNLTLAWSKLKETEGQLTDARNGFEQVLAQEPDNVDATLGMARLNVRAQRLVEAEEGYERAVALAPKSSAVLSEVGQFYAEHQRWERALALLREAQRIEPHEKRHHYYLAMALTKSGQTEDALPHFTESVGEAAAHYNIGRILIENNRRAEAEEHFALALAKDPSLSDAEYFLTELRNGSGKQVEPVRTAAIPTQARSSMQQTAAAFTPEPQLKPQQSVPVREPLYPHQGYEELPPPGENQSGYYDESTRRGTTSGQIIQVSAESSSVPLTQVVAKTPPQAIASHRQVAPRPSSIPSLESAMPQSSQPGTHPSGRQ